MITVVIPTIWRAAETTNQSIKLLDQDPAITQILLLNNNRSYNYRSLDFINSKKLEVHTFPENIYVSASWNYGIKHSLNETVCLLNDDIVAPVGKLFSYLPQEYGLVGISANCFNHVGSILIKPALTRSLGYGQLLFVKRNNYVDIPSDIRIWYNDDYLFHKVPGLHYELLCNITGTMSTSTFSDPGFEIIKQQDYLAYKRYIT